MAHNRKHTSLNWNEYRTDQPGLTKCRVENNWQYKLRRDNNHDGSKLKSEYMTDMLRSIMNSWLYYANLILQGRYLTLNQVIGPTPTIKKSTTESTSCRWQSPQASSIKGMGTHALLYHYFSYNRQNLEQRRIHPQLRLLFCAGEADLDFLFLNPKSKKSAPSLTCQVST